MADVNLLLATHTTGMVTPPYAQALALACAHLAAKGINHFPLILPDPLVESGRNRLAAFCLENGFTHILFIDADIQFTSADILRLIADDKDFVVGAYMKKIEREEYAVSFIPSADGLVEECPKTGCLKIGGAGAGFMMLKRSVLETMRDRMPETIYTDYAGREKPTLINGFFANVIEDGMLWSEDLTFCNRWRALGGDVWLDPAITLSHWGTYMWRGSILNKLEDFAAPELKAAA